MIDLVVLELSSFPFDDDEDDDGGDDFDNDFFSIGPLSVPYNRADIGDSRDP